MPQRELPPPPPPPPPPKLQARIDIVNATPLSTIQQPPTQPARMSVELTGAEEHPVAFPIFRQLSQRKDTWVISLFVFMHLIAFAATMIVNDCWRNSHSECALQSLGRFSFQPLSENPLLGPSASALTEMGALQQTYMTEHHQFWRLFMSPWLHAGAFHLLINITSIVFVGVHLEQEFGPLRVGIIYILSALFGSSVAALFLQYRPSVSSSGPLFGLLGAMLSGLIRNWKLYTHKSAALVSLFIILMINLAVGLMPYVNNFSNVGGFIAGLLVGFVLISNPQVGKRSQLKGLFEYDIKCSAKLREKIDRPVLRSIPLIIFGLVIAGVTIGVIHGTDAYDYCIWCQYVDCVPLSWWSCSDKALQCETMISSEHLTLTCPGNGRFRSFSFTNISQARVEDLCYLICS